MVSFYLRTILLNGQAIAHCEKPECVLCDQEALTYAGVRIAAVVTASVFSKIFIGMGKLMRVWTGATQQIFVIDTE